jgi:hypothetical protein
MRTPIPLVVGALLAASIHGPAASAGEATRTTVAAGAEWAAIVRGLAANSVPRGRTIPAFVVSDSGFAAEDIVYDARRDRYLLSSIVAPNGDVFVSDGRTGALYAIGVASDSVATLVAPGVLTGPQQPVVAHDGRTLIVPDYLRGSAEVDRGSGAVR